MIIVLKENAPQQAAEKLMKEIRAKGLQIDVSKGTRKTVLGLVGDTSVIDMEHVQGYDYVDKVLRVEEPYKRASRAFHPQNSIIRAGGVEIGGKKLAVMAGPCSVETPERSCSGAEHLNRGLLRIPSRASGKKGWTYYVEPGATPAFLSLPKSCHWINSMSL